MPLTPPSSSEAEFALRERRDGIRRSLSRMNTAGVAVVLITIGLAVAAAIAAVRAGRQVQLTHDANQRALDELWNSYHAQARAGRLSGLLGRKAAGLKAIATAAAIRPSLELRNEAIAHLALFDLEPTEVAWSHAPWPGYSTVDARLEWFVDTDGTRSGTVRVRRIANLADAYRLSSTNGPVVFARFAPNSQRLALLHQNRTLVIWDLVGRTNLHSHTDVAWVDFNADGSQLVASAETSGVRILAAASGLELARFHPGRGLARAVFNPAGTQLAMARGSSVEIWDWARATRIDSLTTERTPNALAWSGELVAAGDGTGEVSIWNRVTKRSRRLPAHQNHVNHIFFSPSGDVLYSVSYDGTTKVWNPHSGRMLLNTSQGFAVQPSSDGRRVAFYSQAGWKVWQVSAPEGLSVLNCVSGLAPSVWHTDFSPDGRWLAATKGDGVWVFEMPSGRRAHFLPVNQARTAHFVQGGSNLLTTSTGRIAFWPIDTSDPTNGTNLVSFRTGPRQLVPLTNVTYLEPAALSLDRRKLVLPVSLNAAAIFDLETRIETLRLTNAILPKLSAFSPDGRWVVTGTFHGRGTRVWDAATGAIVHEFRDGNSSAYFSPEGRFLVAAGSSAYRIYEPGTWRLLREISTASASDLPNLAVFSSDSAMLATVKEMNQVDLIRPDDGRLVMSLTSPDPQVVTSLALGPGDRLLAVATSQDVVQLWDLARLQEKLRPLGLDWTAASPPAPPTNPTSLSSAPALPRLLGALAFGVLMAIACTVFIRHRQARLLATYLELDQRAEEQRRQIVRIQSEAVHAQKMKALGTLAAGVAHDFNNLLSVIRMSNQLTAEAAPDRADIVENTAEIEQAVQQGKKLIRSMLGYSRADPDDTRPFAVPELVEDTVGLLSKQFLGGITLTLELDHDLPPAGGSRGRLEQILLNLIVNAAEAMGGSGDLRIAARRCPSLPDALVLSPRPAAAFHELSVTDSGPGIPPEIQGRIFEPFFTTKHRGVERGTGLGLSTVYAAAEQDGLGLAVQSPAGGGARFLVFVPLIPQEPT